MHFLTSSKQQLWMVGKYKGKGPPQVARVPCCSQIASAIATVGDNTLGRKRRSKNCHVWLDHH